MTHACCSSGNSATAMQILPKQLVPGMLDFYNNYKKAVTGSGAPGADEGLVASVMSAIADRFAALRASTPVTNIPDCGPFRLMPVLSTAAEQSRYYKAKHIGMNTCTAVPQTRSPVLEGVIIFRHFWQFWRFSACRLQLGS